MIHGDQNNTICYGICWNNCGTEITQLSQIELMKLAFEQLGYLSTLLLNYPLQFSTVHTVPTLQYIKPIKIYNKS